MTIDAPLSLHREAVRGEWIDYNNHMNLAYYVLAFDHATDEFFDFVGLDETYRLATRCSAFLLETHVSYHQEMKLGDTLRCTTQLLDFDDKRIHFFHTMYHATEDYLAATTEVMFLHVDTVAGRSKPMPEHIVAKLSAILDAHKSLSVSADVGRVIGIRRRS